jgi:hypothetical protein
MNRLKYGKQILRFQGIGLDYSLGSKIRDSIINENFSQKIFSGHDAQLEPLLY